MAVKPMPKFRVLVMPGYISRNVPSYWKVRVFDWSQWYQSYEVALKMGISVQTKYIRECSAFSKLGRISVNLLNLADLAFIQKLQRNKCKGITHTQYQYLSGIYERQEREW